MPTNPHVDPAAKPADPIRQRDLFEKASPAIRRLAAQARSETRQKKRKEYARQFLTQREPIATERRDP